MQDLLIRADANAQIGMGHAMRCLALAEAWRLAGGSVAFVSAFRLPAFERRLVAHGIAFQYLSTEPGSDDDAQQFAGFAQTRSAPYVTVDGYAFGYQYHSAIKRAGLKLLCIDDYGHAGQYCADFVVNQNPWAQESLYGQCGPNTSLLLGAKYVLLRHEFLEAGRRKRPLQRSARRVLVTLGGGDIHNVATKIVEALAQVVVDDLEAVVVAGPTNPHQGRLCAAVLGSGLRIELLEETESMPQLMDWADLAVSAAGSTCWELAFMGLPAVVVVTADNQQPCAAFLHKMGIVRSLGSYDALIPAQAAEVIRAMLRSSEQRAIMSSKGQELIDGCGAERIVSHLLESQCRSALCESSNASACERRST